MPTSYDYGFAISALEAATAVGFSLVNTGGGCMALEGRLETGHPVLVTDQYDNLMPDPETREGWAVGVYAPSAQYSGDSDACILVEGTDSTSVEALIACFDRALIGPRFHVGLTVVPTTNRLVTAPSRCSRGACPVL